MNGGVIIPDKKTAKALNDLARHTAILRILKDVRIDLEICESEETGTVQGKMEGDTSRGGIIIG